MLSGATSAIGLTVAAPVGVPQRTDGERSDLNRAIIQDGVAGRSRHKLLALCFGFLARWLW